MRRAMELGFKEIAMAILVVVFLALLVLIVLAVVEPGGSAINIFGQRAEGLLG